MERERGCLTRQKNKDRLRIAGLYGAGDGLYGAGDEARLHRRRVTRAVRGRILEQVELGLLL